MKPPDFLLGVVKTHDGWVLVGERHTPIVSLCGRFRRSRCRRFGLPKGYAFRVHLERGNTQNVRAGIKWLCGGPSADGRDVCGSPNRHG